MNPLSILAFWWIVPIALMIVMYKQTARLFGIVIVPEDRIGLVNKKFKLVGGNQKLSSAHIVALNGEAGPQAETLSAGIYYMYWPWQYSIDLIPFTVVPEGQLGLIVAKDGESLNADRMLGKRIECDNFQDAEKFLTGGGQKGRQSAVILAGTYKINTMLFEFKLTEITKINSSQVGLVTTKDGKPLPPGEIAGDPVDGHNNYQDFDKFIEAQGYRGAQQHTLLAGTWNLNPWAVEVKVIDMVSIPIGYVGVVNSFVGKAGSDVSGREFEHGNIVSKGEKGVWKEVYGPGKYAVNTFIQSVELVPTTNLVLNWADARTESHNLDENLSTIKVRSKDGFTFNLDVSQIIHVPAEEAPKVIARFGNMKNLVSQVLEPTIGNYFRNSAQGSDAIGFLTSRQERQISAKEHIVGVLKEYNVKAVDTLIGDITPPAELMATLTNRKLAQENETTYKAQEKAELTRQDFEKQKALANMQPEVVKSERGIQIADNEAKAAIQKATGAAESVKLNAAAEAKRTELTAVANAKQVELMGAAEAGKIDAIGKATANAYKEQVAAMGQDNFTRMQVIKQVADGKVRIMPESLIMGGGNGNGGLGILEAMTTQLLFANQKNTEKAEAVTVPATEVKK